MAHYIRYEFLIPIEYRTKVKNGNGEEKWVDIETDPRKITRFKINVARKFGGITTSNPYAAAMFEGFWNNDEDEIEVDYHHFMYVLVEQSQAQEALKYFQSWKRSFEKSLQQSIVAITHYPVSTIGKLS